MDYLTTSEVKEIELNMLRQLSEFLDSKGLYYMLAYGTLLGAIRHKGFIPWDDDIDILMPRKDYEALLDYYKSGHRIGDMDLLFSTESNDYYYPFAKLCDSKTVAKMESNRTEHGVWIDIFPVDKICEDEKEAEKFQKRLISLRRVVISMTTDFHSRKIDKKTLPKFVIGTAAKIIGKKKITNLMSSTAQRYNGTESELLCASVFQLVTGGILTVKEFYDGEKVPFEGYNFNVTKSYDKYLRSLYGDYMVMPPENKRITHSINAYYKFQSAD